MEVKEEGYLYVMVNDTTLNCKIGVSATDPRLDRVKQLNSGTKSDGEIRCIKTVRCSNYKEAERVLHKIFGNRRIRGEWFRLTPEQSTLLMLLTPSKVDQMIEAWKTSPQTSLKSVFGSEKMFYENKTDYIDKVHKENEYIIAEKTKELMKVRKQKQQLEQQMAAIKFYEKQRESPHASIVRSALAAIPPLQSLNDIEGTEDDELEEDKGVS
jgi:hypothetical protein